MTVGGTTWEIFNDGLPTTIVTELDAQSNGLMQAATYGRGAFQIAAPTVARSQTMSDFGGDGKADISVTIGAAFGASTDRAVPNAYIP